MGRQTIASPITIRTYNNKPFIGTSYAEISISSGDLYSLEKISILLPKPIKDWLLANKFS